MAKCDFFKFHGIPIWSSPGWAHSKGEGVVNLHSHTLAQPSPTIGNCRLSPALSSWSQSCQLVCVETRLDMLTGHRDCARSWPGPVQTVAARWETLYPGELSSGSATKCCPRLSNNHSWTGIMRQRVLTR